MTVDIAEEVHARSVGQLGQCIAQQARATVAAADADVDDIGNGLSARTPPGPRADLLRKGTQAVELGVHGVPHGRWSRQIRVGRRTQGRMQCRPLLACVYDLPSHHRPVRADHITIRCQAPKQLQRLGVETLSGEIKRDAARGERRRAFHHIAQQRSDRSTAPPQ